MRSGSRVLPIAMIATGAMLATTGGAAIGAPHTRATLIATPKLSVTITTTGHGQSATSSMAISGPRTVSAGRVAISLHAVGGEAEVGVAKIKKGHTFKEAAGLFGAFESSFGPMGPTKAGLRGLNNLVRIVTFYGGIDSGSFRRVHGTVVLPKAGTYLLLNDENGPSQPHKLKVTPQVGVRLAPNSTGVVKTRNSKRFAGSSTLPAHGTITFENRATNSPHLLVLQHVKKGTTRTQMIKFLNSPAGESGQPSFGLRESVATDVLSSGQSQTISYHMPAGEYVEMCYFPDLQTGMPHALMGMVRVVHLK